MQTRTVRRSACSIPEILRRVRLEPYEVVERVFEDVIQSPFVLPLRKVLSAAKVLRVNSAKNLLFVADVENKSRFLSPPNTGGL